MSRKKQHIQLYRFIQSALEQHEDFEKADSLDRPSTLALTESPMWVTFRLGGLVAGGEKFHLIGRLLSGVPIAPDGILAVVLARDQQGKEIENLQLPISNQLSRRYVYLKPFESGLFQQAITLPKGVHEIKFGFRLWKAAAADLQTTVTLSSGRDSVLATLGRPFNPSLDVGSDSCLFLPIKSQVGSRFYTCGKLPDRLKIRYWDHGVARASSVIELSHLNSLVGEFLVPSKGNSLIVEVCAEEVVQLNPYLKRISSAKELRFEPWQTVEPTRSSRLPFKIAAILDEFSAECFAPEADFLFLSPDDWRVQIEEFRPDFFFAESAWQGNDGQWAYEFSKYTDKRGGPLDQLLGYCRKMGIPSVFWNKEDPPNFNVFIDVANEFDHVFTTDENCIARYASQNTHKSVNALMFAAQPRLHNPVGKREDGANSIAFAGSWYTKHENRTTTLPYLLNASLAHGLHIFNRQSDLKDERYKFPDEFHNHLYDALPYLELVTAHRQYKVMLNSNSVSDSPTMFARRVFEILASATPVVSTPSIGVERVFGDIVPVVKLEDDAQEQISRLIEDDEYRHRIGHLGYREVLKHHCCSDRLRFVAETIGLNPGKSQDPKVCVVGCTNRPEFVSNLVSNYQRQNYPLKELVLVINSDDFDVQKMERAIGETENVKLIHMADRFSLGECLNEAIAQTDAELIAKMDDDDFYGTYYLSDMCLPFKYTNAHIVGKRSVFFWLESLAKLVLRNPGKDHRYSKLVSGSTLVFTREIWSELPFARKARGTDTDFLERAADRHFKIYSTDRYNHVAFRRADKTSHTWKIDDQDVLTKSHVIADSLDLARVEI